MRLTEAVSPNGISLDFMSQVVLMATCLLSAGVALAFAIMTHPRYTPHMVLVAFWSLWSAAGMADLAFNRLKIPLIPDRLVLLNLNAAFTVTIGGWALFTLRLWREAAVSKRSLEETISE